MHVCYDVDTERVWKTVKTEDLLVKSLLVLGASRDEVGRVIASAA